MFCKNCGKELSEDARFCTECGTPVDDKKNKAQEVKEVFEDERKNNSEAEYYCDQNEKEKESVNQFSEEREHRQENIRHNSREGDKNTNYLKYIIPVVVILAIISILIFLFKGQSKNIDKVKAYKFNEGGIALGEMLEKVSDGTYTERENGIVEYDGKIKILAIPFTITFSVSQEGHVVPLKASFNGQEYDVFSVMNELFKYFK